MTVAEILKLYMPVRRQLMEKHVPLHGWTVNVSPADAADLNMEVREGIEGQQVYGAVWQIDASLSAGEIRIDTEAGSTTIHA